MLVQGSLKHVNESLTSDRFLKFLADEAPAGHYFVAQPPPGIIMTAAIDWRIIVPDTAAIESLAVALWKGYDLMVRPLHGEGLGRTPQVFIKMKNFKGEYDQFVIGKELNKKEGVVHRMRETAAILFSPSHQAALAKELEKTAASDYWLRVS
jgi:hypothetical protein